MFRRTFEDFICEQVINGVMVPWPADVWIEPPTHELRICSPTDGITIVELLMNERDGSDWVYRRDVRVRSAIRDAVQIHRGIPVLAPEIVLLYKSKAPRPIDQADFERVSPALNSAAATWLHDALVLASPGHPWAAALPVRVEPGT